MTFPNTSFIGPGRQLKRPTSSRNGEKEAIWIPMLQSTSKGKDLTEKQLIVLGGTPDQQKEFLEQLNPEQDTTRLRFNQMRKPRPVPVSNKYALGYAYHDVLDADQEDVLARMNVYTLSNSSGAFAPLLRPLLNARTAKDTLVTILLDWSEPWRWARQLRQWVRLLRKVILSLDDETKIEMEENMNAWKEKRTGPHAQSHTAEQQAGAGPAQPLGQGEWDEELGVPLAVVCIKSENIEKLEKEQGWQEDHFDFLLQWVRTMLLKHGASLCFVSSFDTNDVRTLLHSSLNIQSLLRREVVKHNVIDRDKILVPPNWDSWGKIRILRDAFDAEGVAERWSMDVQGPPEHSIDEDAPEPDADSAVATYEASIPKQPEEQKSSKQQPQITVTVPSLQEFLQEQKVRQDKWLEQEETALHAGGGRTYNTASNDSDDVLKPAKNRVVEHTGSHHINVNGIDVDADEATRRLREREQERHTTTKREGTPSGTRTTKVSEEEQSTEQYKNFFASLMTKKASGRSGVTSGVASPRRGSPTPERRITDN
ncbi:hypothetical protein LTR70_009658 [Exophiala xenobiotica]|uniref:Dynein light intermediate chain n=1 Tax=Lithohypha guttulata TaxID=1690604 RepID=A0ABR0JY98_9EURO|nr:hypothetical protein LTR24_009555 [Lithohypha guttulata]KAK5310187.1 hypothetical protein LTR70_009658 [Exophiala xenobiotica]